MTVYVDDMRMKARVGSLNGRWSHLMADTEEELTMFAGEIGLKPEWIQHPGTPDVHFDVMDGKRAAALAAGAVSLPCRSVEWMDFFEAQHDKFVRVCENCDGPLRYLGPTEGSVHWFETACTDPVPGFEDTKREWMPRPPEDWTDEIVVRVSGEIICEVCKLPYWKHPYIAKREIPTLVRGCDGKALKL